MKKFALILVTLLVLAACDSPPALYANDPHKRQVMIDDHIIYVVPQRGHVFVAWGGDEDQDGFVQYRQQRAIELSSHCRVNKVLSAKTDAVLRATVKCAP